MEGEFLIIGVQFSLLITAVTIFTGYFLIGIASVLWTLGENLHRSFVKNHQVIQTASQRHLEQLRAARYHSPRKSRISTLVQ